MGQKGMVTFKVKRGMLRRINCSNTAPVFEMPYKGWQTSHGYIHLKFCGRKEFVDATQTAVWRL